METVNIPEPDVSCECKKTKIEIIQNHQTGGDSSTYLVIGRVVCRDCGAVMTQLTPNGFDDVFRLTFGKGLEANLAKQRAEKAAKKRASSEPKPSPKAAKSQADPSKGLPGTEMLLLTSELGINSPPGCGCKGTAATMDRLGVDGCRERINELKLSIAASWESWGWKDKLSAVSASAWKAVGLGVRPTDPVRDLVEISIERADKKRETV